MSPQNVAIWLIAALSIALVLIRPKGWPEAWWAGAGACLLLMARLLPLSSGVHAVGKGLDVYFFLTGMMIISELARREGVFDWISSHAVRAARGSRVRLFVLIYTVGTLVTIFLSNDATAVVLTPAVLTAVRTAEADPLPYLLICALIANAASFVLPISNPANLVVFRSGMPPLGRWLLTFGLPSVVSIGMTFLVLRWQMRGALKGDMKADVEAKQLSRSGKITLYGIGLLAFALLLASTLNIDLGAPACIAAVLAVAVVSSRDHATPKDVAKGVSWSVLPLVAGLFVIVEALNRAGALPLATNALRTLEQWPEVPAVMASGFGIAFVSNLMNNLPSGLISGAAVVTAHAVGPLRGAILVGVDLGPNLSVTGSLATILWLLAMRRDGQQISFWQFLKVGSVVMPLALVAALLVLLTTAK